MTYELDGKDYTDVVTKDYYYTAYLNRGAVLLNTYNFHQKYAYNFEISNNKVEIRGQAYSEDYSSQELTSLDSANKFLNFDENENIDFVRVGDTIYTTDENIIGMFSSQLDFTGIKRVGFYKIEHYMVVVLQGYDSVKDEYYTPSTGAVIFIDNIGTSKLDVVEDYLKQYVSTTDTLENKADNLFGNVSFVSAVYDNMYLEESNYIERQGFSNLDIYNDYVRITDINEDNVSTSLTYQKLADGNTLNLIGVNGKNEVETTKTSTTYEDFGFVGQDKFNLNQFMKLTADDEYYTYLGTDASSLAYAITQHLRFLQWPVEEIKVKVENDKVTQMIFSTGLMQDTLSGNYFYRYVDTRVLDTPNVIEGAVKKTPSVHDEEIKGYLSYLNQDNSVFTSIEKDSAWDGSRFTKVTKGTDFLLKGTYIVNSEDGSSNNMESLGSGYYLKDGKLYSFTFDEENNITLNKIPVNKSLKDVTNFSVSSEVLNLKDNVISTTGDIVNIGQYLGNIYNPLTVDARTLNMTVENEKNSSMSFAYFGGTEEITFDYSAVTLNETMRANLDKAISEIDTDKKMTWEDDMRPEVYENLLGQYGKEIADKVPYLFDQDFIDSGNTFDGFYDNWDDEENPYFVIIMNTDMDLSYISKYKAHLLSEGYVTTDNKTFIKESDNLKLYVDEDNESNEFIHLYVLA